MNTKKREGKLPSGPAFSPTGNDPTPESLIVNLSSHDDAIRLRSRLSLVAVGKAAVPSLTKALKDKDNLTRWEAAKALGEIGAPESAPALVDALEDEEFDVRWLAAEGLVRMSIRALKPLLHALTERGDSELLREGAHHVIHDLNKGALKKYLEQVHAALNDVKP